MRCGGRDACFMRGIVGGEQKIGFRQVLDVHESIGGCEPRLDAGAIRLHRAVRGERPGRCRQPGFAGGIARLGREGIGDRRQADAVLSGTRREHARGAVAIGILVALILARRERLGGGLEQLRKAGEDIAEQARHAQRDVDAGAAELGRRDDVVAGDAAGGVIPARRKAGEMQRHGKLLAGGPHRRRAPEIDHEAFRPVAVILQMATQQLFREPDALRMRRRRRHRARINGKEIASGRQHVLASAIGRARRPRRNALSRERGTQRIALRVGAGAAAEHVQPVAELALLEIADEAIDPRDRFRRCSRCIETEIVLEACRTRFVADRGDQTLTSGGIEAIGGRIFVQQTFEPAQAVRHRGLFAAAAADGRW